MEKNDPNTLAPDCGRRLLPVVIDQLARDEPKRAWASLPIDDYDLAKGFEDITYEIFANSINKLAWFIEKTVGKSSNFETIAYLGPPDIRYHMMQMAACKTGHKVLFSSQLNSVEIHKSLMDELECKALFSTIGVHVVDVVRARPSMTHAIVDELDEILDLEERAPAYPYSKTFEEAKYDPYLVLHSSGTTGNPKPVVINHAIIAAVDAHRLLPDVHGRSHIAELSTSGMGKRMLMVTSPYHALAAGFIMCISVFGGSVYVPGYRHRSALPADICQLLDHANVVKAILTPWMMEDIARRPDAQKYIESFEAVTYGGAPLTPYAAEVWSKYTQIQNGWGSTETLGPPQLRADNSEYAYVLFDPVHSGITFRDVESEAVLDGEKVPLYEMVFTLTPDAVKYGGAGTANWHARMGIAPDSPRAGETFAIADLWTPHPDPAKAPFAWRFIGRMDDLITFTPGVNFHPGALEKSLASHPSVAGALVIGDGHQEPLVLVELVDGLTSDSPEVANLWKEAIEPVNETAAIHGRVAETHVIKLPHGSLVRTPKGSIVRGQSVAKFADKIDETYEMFGDEWKEGHRSRYGSVVQSWEVTVADS